MNIIKLPVNGQEMILNWDQSKFSMLIPVSSDSSILVYDQRELTLSIGSVEFNELLESYQKLFSCVRKGEIWCQIGTNSSHLVQVIWDTKIDQDYKKCKTKVYISHLYMLSLRPEDQAVVSFQYPLEHEIEVCMSEDDMAEYVLSGITEKLYELYVPDHMKNKLYNVGRSDEHYLCVNDIAIFTDPHYLLDRQVSGVALEVMRTEFGSLSDLISKQREVDAANARAEYEVRNSKATETNVVVNVRNERPRGRSLGG